MRREPLPRRSSRVSTARWRGSTSTRCNRLRRTPSTPRRGSSSSRCVDGPGWWCGRSHWHRRCAVRARRKRSDSSSSCASDVSHQSCLAIASISSYTRDLSHRSCLGRLGGGGGGGTSGISCRAACSAAQRRHDVTRRHPVIHPVPFVRGGRLTLRGQRLQSCPLCQKKCILGCGAAWRRRRGRSRRQLGSGSARVSLFQESAVCLRRPAVVRAKAITISACRNVSSPPAVRVAAAPAGCGRYIVARSRAAALSRQSAMLLQIAPAPAHYDSTPPHT